jgi:HAD superfamily hydrolase (TIGR01509 family)
MNFDLVIFDCDGVLVDTEPIANRVLVEVLGELDLAMTPDECSRTFLGRSAPACCDIIQDRLGRPLPAHFLRDWEARMHAAFRTDVTAIPGIADALDQITIPLCVASSGSHARMEITLGTTGLLRRLRGRIFSSADVPRGKPFPDLYLHAAQVMGVAPLRCAVIEDTVVGVQAGVAAGMTVFGFAGGEDAVPLDLERAGALVFAEMRELPQLLHDGAFRGNADA